MLFSVGTKCEGVGVSLGCNKCKVVLTVKVLGVGGPYWKVTDFFPLVLSVKVWGSYLAKKKG